MIRNLICCFVLICVMPIHIKAEDTLLRNYNAWGEVVIQHEGRLKPLDTFARVFLLSLYEKTKLPHESALDWLMNLMLFPENSYRKPIFRIRNLEVIHALELSENKNQLYSFLELSQALQNHIETLQKLHTLKTEERSLVENQLMNLYMKSSVYLELSRSLTGLMRNISIQDAELAQALNIESNQKVSYLFFILHNDLMQGLIDQLNQKKEEEYTESDRALIRLVYQLNYHLHDQTSKLLQIIPPESELLSTQWASPWQWMDGHRLTEHQKTFLISLETLVNETILDTNKAVLLLEKWKENVTYQKHMHLEVLFNHWDLFYKSLYFYLFSFLGLLLSFLLFQQFWVRCSYGSMFLGWLCHTVGLVLRIIIMQRPPVSNLYESIIFVGWVVVSICFYYEWRRKNMMGLFIAALMGSVLHFLGFSYAADGDTMGMLVAVLDSNFWLATHVVTITIGYGATLAAGTVAHVYVLLKIFGKAQILKEIHKNAIGLTIVALFFTLLGTILGGIWADQSWGRFWGWDPKENGALLIVLWLLLLVHGRLAGVLKEFVYELGLCLSNVMVALAWFGVNLLSVGLHSYGFTENIANNLFLFCAGEILFIGVAYFFISIRNQIYSK